MALEYVYIPTERWGAPLVFASLADLEEAILEVCEKNPLDFEFPEDGLRPGRDYECRWDETCDDYSDWADSPYSD